MVSVNLSLLTAILFLGLWLALLVHQVPSGLIHVLYAAGVVLLVRRIVAGAPRFLS